MRLSKHKKAVSPLIATIILIALTIAGGLVVYELFTSTANVASSKAQVSIDSMDLVKTTGSVVFTITVKNSGNKPVASDLNVTLAAEDPVSMTLPALGLEVGESVSTTMSGLTSATYIVGDSYLVTVSAKYSDGSTTSITQSVICRS
jgi:flagellin-like protein